jgi:hypothetical protein
MLYSAEVLYESNRNKAAMIPWLDKVNEEIHRCVPDSYKNFLPKGGDKINPESVVVLNLLLDKKDCDLLAFIQRTHAQRPEECCSMDCSAPRLP